MFDTHYSNQREIGIEKIWLNENDFIKVFIEKFPESNEDYVRGEINKVDPGDFICRIYNDDSMIDGIDYFKKDMRAQTFDMRYSNVTGRTLGSEVLFSNLQMPDVREFLPHYQK